MNLEEIVSQLSELKVTEVADLVAMLEKKWGVTAAVPSAPAAAPAAAAAAESVKTDFDVILKSFGDAKINVIKIVREITGLGLKEASDLVNGAPKTIKEKVSKADADSVQKKLEEAGATVEVK